MATGSKKKSRGSAIARHDRARKDKDGDLAMGVAIKGRGGISKSSSRSTNKPLNAPTGPRRSVLAPGAQRQILKHVGAGDVSIRETRMTVSRGLQELKISNWSKSKAASSADGGVSSLISWIEKKASNRLGSRIRSVKVKKSRVEGQDLIISIPAEDVGAVLRLNGYLWAGTNVSVSKVGENAGVSSETAQLKDMIKGVLERRYNQEEKLLDLSALGQDPELQARAVFNQKSTTSKFFPAMMKVLEDAFDTPKEKDEAILSVSLANNELSDLTFVTTLSATLPKLLNLDLSHNKFDKIEKLALWRRRFHKLSHLIVTDNPFEQTEPDFAKTLITWFSSLRMLNGIQVRTEEELANKSKITDLPFPIRSPSFQDEGGIVENFVRTFFAGFDTDRNALVAMYYDDNSTFSFAVNTQAQRDPSGAEATEKQDWAEYIKGSRNLKKVTQLPARQNRLFKGQKTIADTFAGLPKSKHPDLAAEARKWMIEAHIQPGVPDASSTNGVDGFMVVIHGEYEEAAAQGIKKRSFDRVFSLGPGGSSGVRIVNDMLTVRAYGGSQAFEPEQPDQQVAAQSDSAPQLPAGLTIEVAEQMVTELQKQTNMTVAYAKECLEQVAWDFQTALQAFASVKATLPATAFMQAV